jgi:hypothetical protein
MIVLKAIAATLFALKRASHEGRATTLMRVKRGNEISGARLLVNPGKGHTPVDPDQRPGDEWR